MQSFRFAAALALLLGATVPAGAVPSGHQTDPVGDFLSTYTGPQTRDLDVVAVDVRFQGHFIKLTGVMDGDIDPSHAGIYAWGFDRGAGQEFFVNGTPSAGKGVKFDTVLLIKNDGTASTLDFLNLGAGFKSYDKNLITISGNTVTALLDLDQFESRGLSPGAWTFNLWPRAGLNGNQDISDFAPDAMNVGVPEPASLALLGSALVMLFVLHRRREHA